MSIKRITEEEAKEYIPCSEDFTSHGIEKAQYFTLTPTNDGWEEVTYYTARNSAMYPLDPAAKRSEPQASGPPPNGSLTAHKWLIDRS